ncbi:MAG: Fe-S cluster assembly protein SufB [Candidatus Babeliaceae bacterium]|nr:Fe-S cluster assembly protein SufB [Candidatus Babeliaceae bacterium]
MTLNVASLTLQAVKNISHEKQEPLWMVDFRYAALKYVHEKKVPGWAADLSGLDLSDITMYVKPLVTEKRSWHDVPQDIKSTFETLGIPQAEQKFLAGVGAQFESEVIYKSLKQEWSDKGVIFCSMETAVKEHSELVKKYFATVIPAHDNIFAALNSAFWSGGSFVYVPPHVQVTMPLQAYFRINQQQMGQFERTLIIADVGSSVHYVEGCSAPIYSRASLHSAVVEIVALPDAHVQYTTIQNWAPNVYNLVTKRAIAYRNARVSWVDGNFGSAVTMKYPCVVLKEPGAQGQVLSLAVASVNQHQDAGAKMVHMAPHTHSTIVSKSISQQGGRASYRGLVKVVKSAHNVKSRVQCDALLLDDYSRSDTYPTVIVAAHDADVGHEASVSKVSDAQLEYLCSRGLTRQQALGLVMTGFVSAFVEQLPMEYAVEINRLISATMEGSIG